MLICGGLIAEDRLAPLTPGVSDVAALVSSLEAASTMRLRRMAPAHGHIVEEAKKAIPAELERRAHVDAAILDAMKSGAATPDEIVAALHPERSDDGEIAVLVETAQVHLAGLAAAKQAKESKGSWAAA